MNFDTLFTVLCQTISNIVSKNGCFVKRIFSYLVHQPPVSNHPKTGTLLKRILRGWRTAQGFAPGDKGNYKVPDTDERQGQPGLNSLTLRQAPRLP